LTTTEATEKLAHILSLSKLGNNNRFIIFKTIVIVTAWCLFMFAKKKLKREDFLF